MLFLFALLTTFVFIGCSDNLEFPEKNGLKSANPENQVQSQDGIRGDTIVPPYEEPKYPIDSITPPPIDPDSIDDPKYPIDSIIPSPSYPDSIVNPIYPVDTLVTAERINTFKLTVDNIIIS